MRSATVTGVWLRRIDDHAVVSVEVGGQWIDVIQARLDGQFSHIVEPAGIARKARALDIAVCAADGCPVVATGGPNLPEFCPDHNDRNKGAET